MYVIKTWDSIQNAVMSENSDKKCKYNVTNSKEQMVWDDISKLYIMNELLTHYSLIYTIYIGMDVQTDDEPLAGVSVIRWKKTCCQREGVNLIYRKDTKQSL